MNNLTAVILAAGMGTRLGNSAGGVCKALIDVNGRPLVSYGINFLKAVGTDRIIAVGGYQYDEFKKTVKELDSAVEVYENIDYKKQSLYSLEKVLPKINESFLIFHCDHLYQKDIAEKLKFHFGNEIIIFTFKDRPVGEDETKILVEENAGILKDLSKKLEKYNRGDFAIMYIPKEKINDYKKAVEMTKEQYGKDAKVVDIMRVIVKNLPINVYTVDMEGVKMMEIDYPDELEKANQKIRAYFDLYL